jgi:hypothetical protein
MSEKRDNEIRSDLDREEQEESISQRVTVKFYRDDQEQENSQTFGTNRRKDVTDLKREQGEEHGQGLADEQDRSFREQEHLRGM